VPNVRRHDSGNRQCLPALRCYCSQIAQFGRRGRAYHNAGDRDFVCSLTTLLVSPKSPPKRRPAADRRALHDNEAGSLEMLDQPLGHSWGASVAVAALALKYPELVQGLILASPIRPGERRAGALTHGEQYCTDFDPSTVLRYHREACRGDRLTYLVSTIRKMADGTKPAARDEARLERVADVAHEERLKLAADMVRRIPGAEGRASATRALAKLKVDPDAVRGMIELLAIASSPPLRRLTSRRKVGLLPGEALQRLNDDLANWTDLEPVVVYAADLRTLIELTEPWIEAAPPTSAPRGARGVASSLLGHLLARDAFEFLDAARTPPAGPVRCFSGRCGAHRQRQGRPATHDG
jgi:pimeloyl-ACP methyl ester carboxylesterase